MTVTSVKMGWECCSWDETGGAEIGVKVGGKQ